MRASSPESTQGLSLPGLCAVFQKSSSVREASGRPTTSSDLSRRSATPRRTTPPPVFANAEIDSQTLFGTPPLASFASRRLSSRYFESSLKSMRLLSIAPYSTSVPCVTPPCVPVSATLPHRDESSPPSSDCLRRDPSESRTETSMHEKAGRFPVLIFSDAVYCLSLKCGRRIMVITAASQCFGWHVPLTSLANPLSK